MHRMSVFLRLMSKPRNQARRLGAESKNKLKVEFGCENRPPICTFFRTWPAATPMHPYVQANANKYDSDLPHAPDRRNLACNEQTTQPDTPIAPKATHVQVNVNNHDSVQGNAHKHDGVMFLGPSMHFSLMLLIVIICT
jgi:hypothetical protein